MIKTSIGELKLSPLKENGKFVFYNDFITINGKVSKGDKVTIYIDGYDVTNGKHQIKPGKPAEAELLVRGSAEKHTDTKNHSTVEEYYTEISELYKSRFYFSR